ncbi:MAG: AAA family ATPase, partial [Chloroflexota bacterium]|nr:AAA family ATPase [Chloroflexota bacterium]
MSALRDSREVGAVVREDFLEYVPGERSVVRHDEEVVLVPTSGGADVEAAVRRARGDHGEADIDGVALVAVGGGGIAEANVLAHVVDRKGDLTVTVFVGHGHAAVVAERGDCPAVAVANWLAAVGPKVAAVAASDDDVADCDGFTSGDAVGPGAQLAASRQWRLVLVGDPRQLQAVGRGGMFDELCRTGRVHELARIHRFRHHWEQAASLRLRVGSPHALDAYFDHERVTAATFNALSAAVARQWMEHTGAGRSVAVVAETNENVDALNRAIQQ